MTLKELQEQFRREIKAAEDIRGKYNGKAEDMTADEEVTYGKHLDAAEALTGKIELAVRQHRLATLVSAT